eukprot:TRINITY_DN3192_c0_g2_i1.p1 TRINITY_DN3192_c0_g2~~TRINITY_DN3192_c0_g2_i1.p1  ORF type:complete len:910 (-),score=260.50 TRINITY_DN3192_c0_g2_i1:2822-5503(-)
MTEEEVVDIEELISSFDDIKTNISNSDKITKFLKLIYPHYNELKKRSLEAENGSKEQKKYASLVSVLAMAASEDSAASKDFDIARFAFLAGKEHLGEWGDEHLKRIVGQLAHEFEKRKEEEEIHVLEQTNEEILDMGMFLIDFFLSKNAEIDAADIALSLELTGRFSTYNCTNDLQSLKRLTLYLADTAKLLPVPENLKLYKILYELSRENQKLDSALSFALILNDDELILESFVLALSGDNLNLLRQLCFIINRHGKSRLVIDSNLIEDEISLKILRNEMLSPFFKKIIKILDIEAVKSPKDVYESSLGKSLYSIKTHNRQSNEKRTDVDLNNLADILVNAFLNAGFGTDSKFEGDPLKIIENFDRRKRAIVASTLGFINLWSLEGCLEIGAEFLEGDSRIEAGIHLALAISGCGSNEETDTVFALLQEKLTSTDNDLVRAFCILGIGISLAGTKREDVFELLLDFIDPMNSAVCYVTCLALGMVFVGTGEEYPDVTNALLEVCLEVEYNMPVTRYIPLSLGLIFMGCGDLVVDYEDSFKYEFDMEKPTAHTDSKTKKLYFEEKKKYEDSLFKIALLRSLAYAGTGDVSMIADLLDKTLVLEEQDPFVDEEEESQRSPTNANGKKKKKVKSILNPTSMTLLGVSLIGCQDKIAQRMLFRVLDHMSQFNVLGDAAAIVPLSLAILSISCPDITSIDRLVRLAYKSDMNVAKMAIVGLGLIGSGSNNTKIAQALRLLSKHYERQSDVVFVVKLAMGLLHMSKGSVSLLPFHQKNHLISPVSFMGLIIACFSLMDMDMLIPDHLELLFPICLTMYPRVSMMLDENLEPKETLLRVGQAVDVVGLSGKPRTVTGFQTQNSPVVLSYGEACELVDRDLVSLNSAMEGFVIVETKINK